MSFNTALSGLNAAQSQLGVISHNIANVNTVGFKESRAEFGDIFATSALGSSSTAIGSGVLLSKVAQQFNQGNLDFTSNTLDMAVSGEGFFVLSPQLGSSEKVYSRAGQFGVNASGMVVSSTGQFLQAFPVNADGTATSTSLGSTQPLRLPSSSGSPRQTSEVELGMNLSSKKPGLDPMNFDPTQDTTYSSSTSVLVYDSLGEAHTQSFYFVKDQAVPNQWAVYTQVDGLPVDIVGGTAGANGQTYARLQFDSAGVFQSQTPATLTTEPLGTPGAGVLTNGSEQAQAVTIDFEHNNPSQNSSDFLVNSLSQDGFTVGRLTGLEISETGVVRATFSNGQSNALGKVAMARFANNQGLSQIGNTSWRESLASGPALAGEANSGSFGTIRSGALETSNVDLTGELVSLITAQRNFQANSKAIETNNAITQTILNIR